MEKVKNRWLIAASAVGVHISIGSVYAYSVWILPLNKMHGWMKTDIALAFSIAILLLGFSAAFLGPRVEAMGPRKSGRLAACFYAAGAFGSAAAVYIGSLPLFILFYGVVGGIGLGTGYITPVSTLVKWFPDKRGLATGIAIMGFGFGAMVFGPIIAALCEFFGPYKAFTTLGVVYFLLIFSSALYLAPPPEGWKPKGSAQTDGNKERQKAQKKGSRLHDGAGSATHKTLLLHVDHDVHQHILRHRPDIRRLSHGAAGHGNERAGSRLPGGAHGALQRPGPHRMVEPFRLSRQAANLHRFLRH